MDEAGELYHVKEGDEFFEIESPGHIFSSDTPELNLYINNEFNGIVVNNYVAINNNLLEKGIFHGGNLKCHYGEVEGILGGGKLYVCDNGYGERVAYKGDSQRGVFEFFIVGNGKVATFKLVGSQGVGFNCNW